MEVGEVAHVVCHGSNGLLHVTGWIVHLSEGEACIGTALGSLSGIASKTSGKAGGEEIGFIKVKRDALLGSKPAEWKGLLCKDLPTWSNSHKAWGQVADKDLSSSGAEGPRAQKPARSKTRIEEELGSLKQLFQKRRGSAAEDDEDEEETEDEDEDLAEEEFLRPGAAAKKSKSQKATKDPEPDLKREIAKALAGGQSATELLPLAMMAMLGEDKKRSRRSRAEKNEASSLLGGSSSDESDDDRKLSSRGLRAVSTLHRLHDRIQKNPRKIYLTYEKEIREELGIVPGQSWTLKDYMRKQPWGKFKGIYRCAMMDVAAYEQLRAGNHEIAAAQLVQNMKAKLQSVLQGGDWASAWLLTGLVDPMQKRDFAGTREEMSVISGYVEALASLKKKVKEANAATAAEDEGEASFVEEVQGDDQALQWWSKAFVNTFVAWGNFVVLGCPGMESAVLEPRVFHRVDVQQFSAKLLGEVVEFATVELVFGSLACSGKRSVLEEMLRLNFASYGVGQVPAPAGALPVAADRVAVPETAGVVDPLDWLPPGQAAVVEHLEDLRLPEAAWGEVVVACHRVPQEHEANLARKLLSTGMAQLVCEQDLPRTSDGKLLCGGLFCVGKDEQHDRLIYDRRPENSTMPHLGWEALPSGACFVRLLLEPNEFLRGSGDDLKNFYYMLKLPSGWVRYNPVGRRVDKAVVREFGGNPAQDYRLCFRVLGMGDKNACSIAQATHESILKRHGLLKAEHKLVYGDPVPTDPLWEGIYLDDLLITLKVAMPSEIPLDGSFVPPPPQDQDLDMLHAKKAEAAYVEAKLPRALQKSFRAQVHFKAWGAAIDGIKGTVGAPMDVRRQLWWLIAQLVASGRASREALEKLGGFVAFVFQFRREFFCLLHHFYVFVAKLEPKKIVRLPGHIADELRSVALHLPLATWCMRSRISPSVLATDATPTSGGAVRAFVAPALASELWRRSEIKGAAVRLDPECDQLLKAPPLEASKFAASIAPCLRWQVVGSYSFRNTHHINLQEARALKREVVRLAGDPGNMDLIQIALNDSMVVVGAVCKGRSSSFRLNGILRSQLPFLAFGRVHLALLWVETSANLADWPSRFRPLPAPSPPTSWMQRFGLGLAQAPIGWELFAEQTGVTAAYLEQGWEMLTPAEGSSQLGVFDPEVDRMITERVVDWVWFSPPAVVFTDRRGGKADHDLFAPDPKHEYHYACWARSLELAAKLIKYGGYFVIEHPRCSRAWRLRSTELFLRHEGAKFYRWDSCAYTAGGHDTSKSDGVIQHAALSSDYRRNLREAGQYLLQLVHGLGGSFTERSSPAYVDRLLEKAICHAYDSGEKRYWVVLGVLGIQRTLRIAGPLLKNSWSTVSRSFASRVVVYLYRINDLLFPVDDEVKQGDAARGLWLHAGFSTRDLADSLEQLGIERAQEGAKKFDHSLPLGEATLASDMEEHRETAPKRATLRLSREAAPGGRPQRSSVGLGKGVAAQTHAGAEDLIDAAVPANELLEAVSKAATRLGPEPVSDNLSPAEVIADPAARETAARWRAGPPARRLTSVLARMVQALQGYGGVVAGPVCPAARPVAQGVASPECSAPKRRAGPMKNLQVVSADSPSAVAASTSASWSSPWNWARQLTRGRLLRFNWKTVLAVLVVIMFPRLIALVIAITLRLVAKAVMSVASHVLRELWFQLNATAAEIEEALVDWLYGQL
ncbi:unnamed protein product, partial [Symbiodinium microadriaticum]